MVGGLAAAAPRPSSKAMQAEAEVKLRIRVPQLVGRLGTAWPVTPGTTDQRTACVLTRFDENRSGPAAKRSGRDDDRTGLEFAEEVMSAPGVTPPR